MGRKRQPQIPITELCPERCVDAEEDGELVVVLRPRYTWGPFAWWLQPRLRNPYFRVHLDTLGSYLWRAVDGESTVGQIVEQMEQIFTDQEQLLQRVVTFVRELERGRMLRLVPARPRDPDRPPAAAEPTHDHE